MTKTYFVAYRIAKKTDKLGNTYDDRRDSLLKAIKDEIAIKRSIWEEPTSYLLFSSKSCIDTIAALVNYAINSKTDMAIVGIIGEEEMRYIGKITNSRLLRKFVPFAKEYE